LLQADSVSRSAPFLPSYVAGRRAAERDMKPPLFSQSMGDAQPPLCHLYCVTVHLPQIEVTLQVYIMPVDWFMNGTKRAFGGMSHGDR